MHKLLPVFFFFVSLALQAQEKPIDKDDKVEWKGIASLSAGQIGNMAIEYLKKTTNKFHNADLVALEVRASYRNKQKDLSVILTSRAAITDGKKHPIEVTSKGVKSVANYIIFDIVVVHFGPEGKPKNSEVFGEKFFGNKKELNEYLQNL